MEELYLHPGGAELTIKAGETAGMKEGENLIDIGCGTGASMRLLKDTFGVDTFGIDIMSTNDGIKADASEIPFEDCSFDYALMECVVTLLEDIPSALKEARRVLKKGGKLIISFLCSKPGCGYEGSLSSDSIVSHLKDAGFSIESISDESDYLKRYLVDIIFKYDSFESFAKLVKKKYGYDIDCNIPAKCGYTLIIAQK